LVTYEAALKCVLHFLNCTWCPNASASVVDARSGSIRPNCKPKLVTAGAGSLSSGKVASVGASALDAPAKVFVGNPSWQPEESLLRESILLRCEAPLAQEHSDSELHGMSPVWSQDDFPALGVGNTGNCSKLGDMASASTSPSEAASDSGSEPLVHVV
jgi:hypothetical protein